MDNKKRILFIFSHPDDAEIYSGGLLLKIHQKFEIEIYVIFDVCENKEIREKEAQKAMEMIGNKVIFVSLQDDSIQDNVVLDTKISNIIQHFTPDLIITHNPFDYHTDHVSVCKSVKRVASYKIPVIYTDTLCGDNCEPDLFCDITEYMNRKIELIKMHGSQIEKCDYTSICEIVNHFRGIQYFGKPEKYCEGYCLSSKYHLGQIVELINKVFLD